MQPNWRTCHKPVTFFRLGERMSWGTAPPRSWPASLNSTSCAGRDTCRRREDGRMTKITKSQQKRISKGSRWRFCWPGTCTLRTSDTCHLLTNQQCSHGWEKDYDYSNALGLFEIDKDPPRGGLSLSVRVILKALQTDSRIPPPSKIRTFIIILKLLSITQNSNFAL